MCIHLLFVLTDLLSPASDRPSGPEVIKLEFILKHKQPIVVLYLEFETGLNFITSRPDN